MSSFSFVALYSTSFPPQAQKELLDAELDLYKKSQAGEDTAMLKMKYTQLQIEVSRSLKLQLAEPPPEGAPTSLSPDDLLEFHLHMLCLSSFRLPRGGSCHRVGAEAFTLGAAAP